MESLFVRIFHSTWTPDFLPPLNHRGGSIVAVSPFRKGCQQRDREDQEYFAEEEPDMRSVHTNNKDCP